MIKGRSGSVDDSSDSFDLSVVLELNNTIVDSRLSATSVVNIFACIDVVDINGIDEDESTGVDGSSVVVSVGAFETGTDWYRDE